MRLAYDNFDANAAGKDLPPLMILHGLFGSKRNFRELAKMFNKETGRQVNYYFVVALVMRGALWLDGNSQPVRGKKKNYAPFPTLFWYRQTTCICPKFSSIHLKFSSHSNWSEQLFKLSLQNSIEPQTPDHNWNDCQEPCDCVLRYFPCIRIADSYTSGPMEFA